MSSKWEPHKEKIGELYLNNRMTLELVMATLESDGFVAR